MPNEENGDHITDNKDGDPRVESPVRSSGHHDPPTDASEKHAHQEQNSSVKLAEDIRTGERWIIGIGIATLVINTVIALIYWQQLYQMKEATRAAVASAEASKKALRTTNDTLVIANQSLRLDKRAWVGISPPVTLTHFEIDPSTKNYAIGYAFMIKNFGPAVALHVASDFEATTKHLIVKAFQETCEQAAKHYSKQAPAEVYGGHALFPNQETRTSGDELGNMEQLHSEGGLYVVGCILYEDQFGVQHRTQECFRTLNDMDLGALSKKPQILYACSSDAN